jgi:sulfatase modifying factor 1
MKKLAIVLFLAFSILKANASSQWMWHGAFPWVYSHAESSWWYMKAGTDGKFLAWKHGDQKWYSFDEVGKSWIVVSEQGSQENKAGDTFSIPFSALEMIWVEPGTFTMGSPPSEAETTVGGSGRDPNETQHQVTLTNGFWLGKHEVTQDQWEKVMGSNPSHFKGGDRPVETVSWDDVTSFCEKLTEKESFAGRLPAGMSYQLPTEAQWEYACRAGTTTAYSWGDDFNSTRANYTVQDPYSFHSISGIDQTRDVGQYAANPWGFYDMHGNVREWCADRSRTNLDAYPTGSVTDPTGPADGSGRQFRGGSWKNGASRLRSANRTTYLPNNWFNDHGFRLSLRPASK